MSQEWECRIARGTKFEDIPDDWVCPDCQVGKEHVSPPANQAALGGEAA